MISGLKFSFDRKKNPKERVIADSVRVGQNKNLNRKKHYIVTTILSCSRGGEGYASFRDSCIERMEPKSDDKLPSL